MRITLNTFANIRDVIGSAQVSLQLEDGSNQAGLLRHLSKAYGPNFDRQIRDQITGEIVPFLILVNGRSYRSIADMHIPLHDGDEVSILIPFDGG